jgi:hypothetical protein
MLARTSFVDVVLGSGHRNGALEVDGRNLGVVELVIGEPAITGGTAAAVAHRRPPLRAHAVI